MKYITNYTQTTHEFQNKNLVTQTGRGKSYDLYECQRCGLQGKRLTLDASLQVDGRTKDASLMLCPKAPRPPKEQTTLIPSKVRIGNYTGFCLGDDILKEGTDHFVIDSPNEKYPNTNNSLWVMGSGKNPVRLLPGEFKVLDYEEIENLD
jgi:hypothetical protein